MWLIYDFLVSNIGYMIYINAFPYFHQKSWGAPSGAGHAFPRQWHMRRGVVGYLFLPGFSSMNDAIHGWMTGRIDGWVSWWKKLHVKRPRRPLLYVMGEMISTWQNKQNKKKTYNVPPSLINKYIIIPYLDYSLDLLISFIYLLFLFYFLFCCCCWVRLFAIFWREP